MISHRRDYPINNKPRHEHQTGLMEKSTNKLFSFIQKPFLVGRGVFYFVEGIDFHFSVGKLRIND